jgi:hypothetical protein
MNDYQMYSCLITHKETNVSWSVFSYAKSPEQALQSKRKTWARKDLWDIEVSLDKPEEII